MERIRREPEKTDVTKPEISPPTPEELKQIPNTKLRCPACKQESGPDGFLHRKDMHYMACSYCGCMFMEPKMVQHMLSFVRGQKILKPQGLIIPG
jgi:hypothetical protein